MSKLIFSEQSAVISTPSAGKAGLFFDNSSPSRLISVDDGGSINHVGGLISGSTSQATGFASDTYLAGSGLTIFSANQWKAGTQYYCGFDMVKTGAGTAAFTVNIRMGTLGTTGDASILSLAFAVGTANADTGWFELLANFRSIGSGTSAVLQGILKCSHHLAATGLITTGASGFGLVLGTSSGFNSTTQTKIGISVNGGTSFSGTNTIVQSALIGI